MSIDLAAALRRRKPERRLPRLKNRPAGVLPGVRDLAAAGRVTLLAATNVYINDAAGRLPLEVAALLDRTLLFHCTVCVAELTTGIAKGDPAHPGWAAARDHYAALIAAIPDSRLLSPDAEVWAEAGLVSGTLARTQGYQPHQRKECLCDALILLTAAKAGLPVLTANCDEFDLLQQLIPEAPFVHY